MKNKVTVIIPTHERHRVLERAIDYYSQMDVNVVIADSSNKDLSGKLPDHFLYLHCPDSFMGDKIYQSLCKVKTKYSCLCSDDDFLSESGLSVGYDFLENNPDYVSVQGHFISFDPSNPKEKYNPLYSNLIGYENSSISIEDRLKKCFNAPQIYALHRTKDLKKCFEITLGISAVTVVEMCVPLVSLCISKHKVLPIFWQARDIKRYSRYINKEGGAYRANEGHLVNNKPSIVITDWVGYLKSEEGQAFKKNFITTVKDIIPDNLDPGILFVSAFQEYLLSQKNKKSMPFLQKNKNTIKKVLPNMLLKRIKRMIFDREKTLLIGVGGYPFNDGVAMSDWSKIIQCILKNNLTNPNP